MQGYVDGLIYMLDSPGKNHVEDRKKILALQKAAIPAVKNIQEFLIGTGRSSVANEQSNVYSNIVWDLSVLHDDDYKQVQELIDKLKEERYEKDLATS